MSFEKAIKELFEKCQLYINTAKTDSREKIPLDRLKQYKKLMQLIAAFDFKENQLKVSSKTKNSLDLLRLRYNELCDIIPSFLEQEFQPFFYLQTYKIEVVNLLKQLSDNGDPKDASIIRTMATWYGAILKSQKAYDVESSFNTYLQRLGELCPFDRLNENQLLELYEIVQNVMSLLTENPTLEQNISADQASLLNDAKSYIDLNADYIHKLQHQTDNQNAVKDSNASSEINNCISYCELLEETLDNLGESLDIKEKLTGLTNFKIELKAQFNLKNLLAKDLLGAIMDQLGSRSDLNLKKFIRILHKAIKPFNDNKSLEKKYLNQSFDAMVEFNDAVPDIKILESLIQNMSPKVEH